MPNIGPVELIVVLLIALIVLGPKRLPATGRSLGHGIREFKESLRGVAGDDPVLDDAPSLHAARSKVVLVAASCAVAGSDEKPLASDDRTSPTVVTPEAGD